MQNREALPKTRNKREQTLRELSRILLASMEHDQVTTQVPHRIAVSPRICEIGKVIAKLTVMKMKHLLN